MFSNCALRWGCSPVALVLLCVALAVCLVVYFFVRNAEKDDFENDFADVGDKLVESFELTLQQRMKVIEGFSLAVTSYALHHPNTTWPMVTLPDYEQRARNVAQLAYLFSINLLPLVKDENRVEWEHYSRQNGAWVAEGLAFQQGVQVDQVSAPPINPAIMAFVDGKFGPNPHPGPYLPLWTQYPSITLPMTNIISSRWSSHPSRPPMTAAGAIL